MRVRWIGITSAVLLLAQVSRADAQQEWSASTGWGVSEDLDISDATSIQSFQIGLLGRTRGARLSATSGIPARSGEDATWGILDLAAFPRLGGSTGPGIQFDIRGSGFAYHDPISDLSGAGGLLLLEPYATYSNRTVRLRVGGGGRLSGTTAGGVRDGRVTGVAASDLVVAPGRIVTLRVRLETLFQDTLTLPHGSLAVAVDYGRGFLWAGADSWTNDALPETGWYAGGSLALTDRLGVETTVGRTSGDPMFWTPARRTWSAGLRYRLGARERGVRLGGSSFASEVSRDGFVLRVSASEGRGAISIAGSFNRWERLPMLRSGDTWVIRLDLEPGTYHLAFVDETGRWFVPESMPGRIPDGMGGFTAVLVVR